MSHPRKKRSRLEICADMLRVAKDGAMKTRIMYRANLSFEQLERYLSLLIRRDLLKYDPAARSYRASNKGLGFLKVFNDLKKFEKVYLEKRNKLANLVGS